MKTTFYMLKINLKKTLMGVFRLIHLNSFELKRFSFTQFTQKEAYLISHRRATPRRIQWSGDNTVGKTTAVM